MPRAATTEAAQQRQDGLRTFATGQLRAHDLQVILRRGARCRHLGGAKGLRHARGLGVVAILILRTERVAAEQQPGIEKTAHLGDVHPGQQGGISGRVSASIGRGAVQRRMDGAHPGHGLRGHGGIAIRRGCDEQRGAPESPAQITAQIGVIPHRCQRQRMQRLQQQRADAADQHRHEVGVHAPAHRIGIEPPRCTRRPGEIHAPPIRGSQASDLTLQGHAQRLGKRIDHRRMLAVCRTLLSRAANPSVRPSPPLLGP